MTTRLLIIAELTCVLLSATSQKSIAEIAISPNVAYGEHASHRLDICEPSQESGRLRGNVVLIHGGGWSGGDKATLKSFCLRFAKAGLRTYNVNYRLADGNTNSWPAQRDDLLKVFQWVIRSNSSSDSDHICLVGFSAGAQIAVQAAAESSRVLAVNGHSPIKCVVSNSGPLDLTTSSPRLRPGICRLLGTQVDQECTRRAIDASRVEFNGSYPKILAIHGTADDLVPYSMSEAFVKQMNKLGSDAALVLYPGGHSYGTLEKRLFEALLTLQVEFVREAMR